MKLKVFGALAALTITLAGCTINVPAKNDVVPKPAATASATPTSTPSSKIRNSYDEPQDVFDALAYNGISCYWQLEETDPRIKWDYYSCDTYQTYVVWTKTNQSGSVFITLATNSGKLKGLWYDELDRGAVIVNTRADANAARSVLGGTVGQF